jgi:5-formyltetrahydrofolate cyclo-ligase
LTGGKPALRAAFAARRAVLFSAQPLAGHTLLARPPRLEGAPGVVAGYWPMRSEIDPWPLMARYARAGWRIVLPITPARGTEGPLDFRLWTTGADMTTHAFGMREPHPSAEPARPGVVLVPLLAFDRAGHRLGYGAGHYDRTLERLRAEGPVRAIGIAFAGQETEALPFGPHDQRLDAVATERDFTEFE